MLYLLTTTHEVKWSDLPASAIRLAEEHGADLGRLDWAPAELAFDVDLLALALRHGHPCTAGLVVNAGHVATLGHGERIRSAHRDAERAQAAIRTNEQLMESLIPGWMEHGRELDRRIVESSTRAAREADEDAAQLLSGDPRPKLAEHWRSLGGVITLP